MNREAFERSDILYGADSARIFSAARVAVCGVGAVGSFALEALARVGVGNFFLFDFDKVETSNINRQLLALNSTVGLKKAELAKMRVGDINPAARVDIFSKFIDSSNCADIISLNPDVIVDAIDSISSKCELLVAAARVGTAVVSSMGAARRTDSSRIRTAEIFKTQGCPLAARVRKFMRAEKLDAHFMCVYSDEVPEASSHVESGGADGGKIMGSTPVVTGAFGLRLAELAIAEILRGGGNTVAKV